MKAKKMEEKEVAAGCFLAGCKWEEGKNVLELENEEEEKVCQMRVILFIPPIYTPIPSIISRQVPSLTPSFYSYILHL